MSQLPLRNVALWDAEIEWERNDSGAIYVWQKQPLGNYPASMSECIDRWAKEKPDTCWMAERDQHGQWHKVSYAELLKQIQSIGQSLLSLNLSVERPLVILSGNSIAHALMALGAQYVGIPSAALAPAYSQISDTFAKLHDIRAQITPGAVFAEHFDDFQRAAEAVFDDLPRLGVTGNSLAIEWNALLSTHVSDAVAQANAGTDGDTVAKFMFTSGTTGSPKAVIQTQRMLCSNMEMVADCYAYFKNEPPVVLDWAPWNHVASGNKVFNMTLYNGGTFYIDAGKPHPKLIQQTIDNLYDVSPNWYFNVPVGYEMLVEAMKADPALANSFFKNLRLMMYAGAAMAEHTWSELDRLAVEATGERVFLSTGLGATETAPFALFCTDPQDKPGNVGVPSKGLTLKLIPHDDRYEARLKGPSVTPGYWRNDPLTQDAFDEEGYYLLGDALRAADNEDFTKGFFFAGRIAENFKMSTGTWVNVGGVRAALIDALQGLARDAVIAGEGREALAALLVPFRPAIERLVSDGSDMTDEQLLSHPALVSRVAELLQAYNKTASGSSMRVNQVHFLSAPLELDKGEVTDKGSVNQRAVLNHRQELVDLLYSDDATVIRASNR